MSGDHIINGEDNLDEGWDLFARFTIALKAKLKAIGGFDENGFVNEFKSLKDNRKRIEFCLNDSHVLEAITQLYEDMSGANAVNDDHNKSLSKAMEMRTKGNDSFTSGVFSEAIQHYSEAICLSPIPSDESPPEEWTHLSLSFADRSQVLFRVEEYESCVEDIDDSLRYKCPEDRRHEILLRKAKCLTSLAKKQSALEVINGLKRDLRENNANINAKEVESELEKLMIELSLESNETNGDNSDNCEAMESESADDTIANINPLLTNASDLIAMSYTESKGRLITAVKDIKFGDTLIVEKPFATYLYGDKYGSYCHYCLVSLDNRFVPCFGCNQMIYCGDSCREKSWDEYHSSECKTLFFLSKEIGISYIVLRILLRTGIQAAIKISKEMSKNLSDYNKCDVLYSCDYSSVYQLLDHQNDHNLDSMLSYSLTAIFILQSLERHSHISRQDPDYIHLGELILKHIQQLSTNLISVLDQNFGEEMNKFGLDVNEDIIGTALYPTICMLNHSCDPNILTLFNGSQMTIKSARSIRNAEEINYCYGPNFQRMSRRDRQTKLMSQYYFECQCLVCANGKENLTRALLCPQCNGAVIHNEDFTSECLNCKSSSLDVRKAIANVENGLQFSAKGIDFLNDKKLSEALISLHKADELLTYNLYIQNRLLCKSKDDLCRCYALMGHFDRAVRYCEQSVKITALIFKEQSTELLMELMKLISLKWEVVDETEDVSSKKVLANELLDVMTRADSIASKLKATEGFENAFQSELQYLNEKRLSVQQLLNP